MAGVGGAVTVIALIGIPGAGKSRLARALADRLRWPIVDRDRFPRARFDEAGKAAATAAAFQELAARLTRGESCIVDGITFSAAAQRRQLRDVVERHRARALLFWMDCPVDVAAARVNAQQDHPAQDRNESLVREVASRFENAEGDVARLDAMRAPEELVEEVLRLLQVALQGDGSCRPEGRPTGI